MKLKLLTIITSIILSHSIATEFTITRLKYSGGGDWYSDPSSIPNLLEFLNNETGIEVSSKEIKASIGSSDFYNNPYYYITGHGKIKFNSNEVNILRDALLNGAFLHADDNYGMDESFRAEMKKVFPEKDWVELPHNHKIFNIFYKFPNGLPKIHQHDGNPPKALALFHNDKIIALYTHESDLGDGWEDPSVHNDPIELHIKALKMGTNIIIHYLTN